MVDWIYFNRKYDFWFCCPYFLHHLYVVKYPEEDNGKDGEYFAKQFKREKFKWVIVEYMGENMNVVRNIFAIGHTTKKYWMGYWLR